MDKGETRRLGQHLKQLREERKLTLGGVEALSEGFGERINKSYLFRVERGKTVPTIPRLRTLAKVYRVKLSMLLDILEGAFEEQEKEARLDVDLSTLSFDQLREHGIDAERQGDFGRATLLYRTALDRALSEQDSSVRRERVARIRLDLGSTLRSAGRIDLAREEAENALEVDGVPPPLVDTARLLLATIYRRLKRNNLAHDVLRSLLLSERSLAPETCAGAYTELGSLFLSRDPRQAAEYYRKALSIVRPLKMGYDECILRYNVALAEAAIPALDRAFKTLQRAREVASRRDYSFWVAKIQTEIGRVLFLMGRIQEAKSALLEANDLARKGDYLEQLFLNQYYLRRIATVMEDDPTVRVLTSSLRYFATRIEESFEELEAFKKELICQKEERP